MLFTGNNFFGITASVLFAISSVQASFLDRPSVFTYWGQNSRSGSNTQKPLATYCDSSSDVIIMSFVLDFKDSSLPTLNLANSCTGTAFPGTSLLKCHDVGKDIKTCQKKGKTVLMSLGGAAGNYGFSNDKDAKAFADTLWNLFGGGSSKTRPFGDAVLDGFDLDIEGGGSTGYIAMVRRLRSHFDKDNSKRYYITAAPQCPYPDAMLETVINKVEIDAVNVQFYNNYCSTTSSSFNFDTWDKWAKKTSPNKKVKVMLSIPGSSTAAGSGYVPFKSLKPIVKDVYLTYSSFGGVTVWDASASYGNTEVHPNYQAAVANMVHTLSKGNNNPTKTKIRTTTRKKTTTTRTKTIKSSKTSTSAPTIHPTDTLRNCVKEGQTCSNNNQLVCSGDSFATCNHGKWMLRGCPSGLTCFSTTDGSSVYCGQGTSKSKCSASNLRLPSNDRTIIQAAHKKIVKMLSGPEAKPYKNSRMIVQFSVSNSTDGNFNAVINARRLDKKSFGKTVNFQFKTNNGIKINSVKDGKVTQNKNQVKIQYRNPDEKAMTVIIQLEGQANSGVLVAPNANSIKFLA
ncbi:glycoside hydrolase superfamily [Gilbertella persicaria]|uniref:glycoside hydrolase superfamily n=1 Tax=Gilbertella persicaria TaxID=101096 RepID=UPI00221E3A89|nr:glycoside hydrolase superfamily [Gilbertella persicaria]KAI8077991.1 glycoside hydrolase superfamily [Gilbertella persicaria]